MLHKIFCNVDKNIHVINILIQQGQKDSFIDLLQLFQ